MTSRLDASACGVVVACDCGFRAHRPDRVAAARLRAAHDRDVHDDHRSVETLRQTIHRRRART